MLELIGKKINVENCLYTINVITLYLMYMYGVSIVVDNENKIWFPCKIIKYSVPIVYT